MVLGLSMATCNIASDWPLSREEKKNRIARLYDDDLKAADSMLSSGGAALEALRNELDTVRQAAGVRKAPPPPIEINKATPTKGADTKADTAEAEVERLRAAVENAAAVLRALLPTSDEVDGAESTCEERTPPRLRAQSEGACRDASGAPIKPALCRTPRTKPKRKVSFGGQPEEEPMQAAATTDSEDENTSSHRKHRDSLVLHKRRACNADEGGDDQSAIPAKPARDSLSVYKERLDAVDNTPASAPEATPPKAAASSKMHLLWALAALVVAALIGIITCQVLGPQEPEAQILAFGDPSCWVSGFRPEYCCLGNGGNPDCWDADHTYERCCLGKQKKK